MPINTDEVYIFFHSSHLSLEIKINSSDGCVLHAAGRQHGGATMSLSVLKGHLILSVESARSKVKVRSLNRHDDGRWHPVSSHTIMVLHKYTY